ncbi:MAG: hypothetical protein JRI85_07730 [Deltaproteobacteria bacterium]|nr:hypothetical protein [Deltaproteobacteria bacterium]
MSKQEIINILMLSPFYSSMPISEKRTVLKIVEGRYRAHANQRKIWTGLTTEDNVSNQSTFPEKMEMVK